MLTALNGYNNKWFLYYRENITVIIKRASVATYVLCVPKICASNAVRSSAPSAPSHPSPLPMGSVWASFTQVPLLPSRGYIRGCWWPHQSSPSGFVLREVSVHTPLPVTWKNGHQSPFSCRTQVCCGSEFVDSRLGPEGDSWNKSCVYKGQLELGNGEIGISLRFQGLVTVGLGLQPFLKSYSLPTSVSDLASW